MKFALQRPTEGFFIVHTYIERGFEILILHDNLYQDYYK